MANIRSKGIKIAVWVADGFQQVELGSGEALDDARRRDTRSIAEEPQAVKPTVMLWMPPTSNLRRLQTRILLILGVYESRLFVLPCGRAKSQLRCRLLANEHFANCSLPDTHICRRQPCRFP
jgi:hypothetical protein